MRPCRRVPGDRVRRRTRRGVRRGRRVRRGRVGGRCRSRVTARSGWRSSRASSAPPGPIGGELAVVTDQHERRVRRVGRRATRRARSASSAMPASSTTTTVSRVEGELAVVEAPQQRREGAAPRCRLRRRGCGRLGRWSRCRAPGSRQTFERAVAASRAVVLPEPATPTTTLHRPAGTADRAATRRVARR